MFQLNIVHLCENKTKLQQRKKIVEFVDLIKRSHYDLEHMKVKHELSNTVVISLLEEKLPKKIRCD